MKRKHSNYKIFILSIIMALLFIIVGANVFVVSVMGYHINSKTNIKEIIEGIHVVDEDVLAERGKITDRNGEIIARDRNAYTVYANIDITRFGPNDEPAHVVDKEKTARALAEVLGTDYDYIYEILNQKDVKQVEFGYKGKNISQEQKELLESMDLPGLGFTKRLIRDYPFNNFASTLVGVALYEEESNSLVGRFGLEQVMNDYLQGTNGHRRYQRDRDGYILPQVEVYEEPSHEGNDIQLTIDRTIQESLEAMLKGIAEDPGVESWDLWAAVMEAKTGKIVAMGDYPNFNPNKLDIDSYLIKGSQYAYEPGSTMKTFTVAAAIEEGVYNGNELFDSSAFFVGIDGDKVYRQATSHGMKEIITNAMNYNYGMIDYDYGFDVSSNVMIAELLTKKLDPEVFHNYLYKLGFFKKVDMDNLPENPGTDLWIYPFEKITNGFGQGSTVNMLQLLQAYSSVVTDGTMVKPYVVDEIKDSKTGEIIYQAETQIVGKPFKESTALEIRDKLRTVVTQGSAQRFNVDEIEVIGKTGTAQKVSDGGGYSPTDYIFSTALAFPYSEPEYIVYYAYEAKYGHNVNLSAKYVNNLVRKIVSNYGLTDGKDDEVVNQIEKNQVDNFINQSTTASIQKLNDQQISFTLIGDGDIIINQYPYPKTEIITGDRIFLLSNSKNIVMPDMTSWSLKEVQTFSRLSGIPIEYDGYGYVESQNINVGEDISLDSKIKLTLRSR